jgi:hypothetical protein
MTFAISVERVTQAAPVRIQCFERLQGRVQSEIHSHLIDEQQLEDV